MVVDRTPTVPVYRLLREHREALFERWKSKMRERLRRDAVLTDEQLLDCLPLFYDELIHGLEQHGGRLVHEGRSEPDPVFRTPPVAHIARGVFDDEEAQARAASVRVMDQTRYGTAPLPSAVLP